MRLLAAIFVMIVLLILPGPSNAQCQFANGNISNTTDPSCSDRMLNYTESSSGVDLIPLGYPVPVPISSLTPVDGFRRYDSLLALHQDLALTEDNVTALNIGSTLVGRDIWAYSIGDTNDLTVDGLAEPAVMAVGGTHAREWQPPEAVSHLIETLAATADDQWLGSYFRDNLNIVLIPVLNVDGFLQTQAHPDRVSADPQQPREGRMRRRNLRNPNTGQPIDNTIDTTGDNFWGVDLNRNSSQGWGLNGGSSAAATSLIYRGPSAETEPEILALQNAATMAPGDRLRLYMDVHSFSQVYLAPSTGTDSRDDYTAELANVMRAVQGYKYGYSADPPNGGIGLTADWFGYTFNIPSWTLETEPLNGAQDYGGTASHGHSGFILPDAEVGRMRNELLASSLIGFYRQSGPPHVVAVRITDRDSGTVRFSAQWQSGATRSLVESVNNALVPGGNYRLRVAFSKPMRFRNTAGSADTYPGQQTGPASGRAELQIPSLDDSNDILATAAGINWHDQPDGVSDGFDQYIFDAASMDFSLPAGLPVSDATPAVFELSFTDMSDFQIDADPATPADWVNGGWTGYEREDGQDVNSGGIDCTIKPFISPDAGAGAPATSANCRSVAVLPPPPPPQPVPTSSGGGGTGFWFLLLAAAGFRRQYWVRPSDLAG